MEGRFVGELGRATEGWIDLQRPREVGRPAVELLVEVVAPTSDGLCEGQGGSDRVGHRTDISATAARHEDHGERAGGQPAEERQATLPDGEDVQRTVDEAVEARDDVPDACAEESEQDRGEGGPLGERGVTIHALVAPDGPLQR